MSHNFVMRDIDEMFDTQSLLLAMSGASLHEQAPMVRLAIATGKPRLVLLLGRDNNHLFTI